MAIRSPLAKRPRFLVPILATIVVLVVLGIVYVNIYTNLLFFQSVHFGSVYSKMLGTRAVLFFVFGLLMALAVAASILIAYRLRPPIRPLSLEQQNLERYRVLIEPFHRWILIGISAFAGILAGLSAAGRWRTYLLWQNGQSFGVKDPQFHRDISYFMFTYPFQRFLLGFAFTVVVVCLIITALTHYLFGGIRLQTQDRVEKVIPAAKVHLSVVLGLFVLLKAVAYYLDRFGLAFSPRGVVTGASYTDVHAVLPAKTILLFISVLCAVLFIYNIRQRGWILPALSFGILVISALVIGGLYPTLIQYFSVRPNESVKESQYIARNITATRDAYGINDVAIKKYPASSTVTAGQVAADTGTVPNTRLLDPVVLSKTYEQLQQIRSFYGFPPTLDIDRYTLNGKTQDYVVSVRELDQSGLTANQRNWINLHLNYTHGKGFVAAPANTVDPNGRPNFVEKNLPVEGPLNIQQDRIYFGEQSPKYSVVDTKQAEIDAVGSDTKTTTTNRYDGGGGVSIGSTFRRIVFGLKFGDKNLVLSSAIDKDSRILYLRNPRTRVQKVAPWLTLDGDPYPAVVNGKIIWILDGYTTSGGYPYSERTSFGDVASDATTGGNRSAQSNTQINYIRNSVKATVDAYTGEVKLYAFDKDNPDPVLRTWMKAFPGTVQAQSAIPADLEVHFHYPEDLFKVQRDLIGKYHVTNPTGFYTQEDFWSVPEDPGNPGTQQPPFYQFAQYPDQSKPNFNLTSPLNSQNAPKLAAFMYVSSDPGDYGKLRILQLPTGVTINGPVQAGATIEGSSKVSSALSLLRQGGSRTISANLLTLPVADGLIYVQPYYVQATGAQGYPLLQDVAVAYGDRIGFGSSLSAALSDLFGVGAGNSTNGNAPGNTNNGGTGLSATAQKLIADASAAFKKAQTDFGKGDYTAYAQDQKDLQNALNQLVTESKTKAKASPSPSKSASASASPSSSATPKTSASPSAKASATASPSPTPTR